MGCEGDTGASGTLAASRPCSWTVWAGCVTSPHQHPAPHTYVVHDESLALPKDEPSRVRVELDGEVGAGGVELLGAAAAHVLPQDAGRELVPVVDGEDVTVGDVQAERRVWLDSSVCREPKQEGLKAQPGDLSPGPLPSGGSIPGGAGGSRDPGLGSAGPGGAALVPAATRAQWRPADGTGQGWLQLPSTPRTRLPWRRRGWGAALLSPRSKAGDGCTRQGTHSSGCPGLAAWVKDHIDPKGGQ